MASASAPQARGRLSRLRRAGRAPARPLNADVRRHMTRWLLAGVITFWLPSAFPCSTRIGSEFEANRQDRAEQRTLVQELTAQADTIVIATTVRMADKPWRGPIEYQVKEVIKGTPVVGEILSFEISGDMIIGCSVAAAFKNPWAELGRDFVLYAQGGSLLRTGAMERDWPEISAKEELRRIRKGLKSK